MTKHQSDIDNDYEIDLKELLSTLWRGKIYIIFFSLLFVYFASAYLHYADRKYLVEYKLKPVVEAKQSNSFASGLGGFATLAGIELPSSTSDDFEIFQELIYSTEVSEIILQNKELIKKIYSAEWSPSLSSFSEPPKSKLTTNIGILKTTLTGYDEVKYMPPDARRLAFYITNNIQIEKDRKTGFLTIYANTSKPEMLRSLITEIIEITDNIMRQRFIKFSKEPLAFYKEKLRTTRSREHREALAELIGKEEQKLMFASRAKYFTAEPYVNPSISLFPTAPKPKIILLISIMIGLSIGCLVAFMRNSKTKVKK